MAPRSQLVKNTIRRLKRRWPTPIVLIKRERGAIDPVTGTQTISKTSYSIRRAILLPQRDSRTFVYDLAYLAGATSNMTQGGHFEEGLRYILIDAKDLNGVNPESGDTVQVTGFFDAEVMNSQEMDMRAGWILRTREIKGVNNVA